MTQLIKLLEEQKKIGILIICTGKYHIFFEDLYKSCEKFFLPAYSKKYFVFTDYKIKKRKNVKIIYQSHLGWPYDTMMRFHMFNRITSELQKLDYLFFFNANMKIIKTVNSKKIIPTKQNNYLVGVKHPGFINHVPSQFPYERNPKSTFYIKKTEGETYYQGCLFGGRTQEFLEMSKILAEKIDNDLSNKIIPVWHDESALNWYFKDKNVLQLGPEFAYPESSKSLSITFFKKKIIQLDKTKYGGHQWLRNKANDKLRITIVGPGLMPIPPKGWGAVEILIYDYKKTLEKLGHSVTIVNTKNPQKIIRQVNKSYPDFVHIQYDEYFDLCDKFECKNVAITSHFGYLEQLDKHGGYAKIFKGFKKINAHIIALSPGIAQIYRQAGIKSDKIHIVPNGTRTDLFKFNPECEFKDKSIYLAKIDNRKRQYLFQKISNLYFVGRIADQRFDKKHPRYLKEWSKDYLYNNLTKYANLVLLSDGEAHPLVCLEAMSAGLGLVLSEFATANLDLKKEWIDIIPEKYIKNHSYIQKVLEDNRRKSIGMRKSIRQYVIDNFDWMHIIKNIYLPTVKKIINYD